MVKVVLILLVIFTVINAFLWSVFSYKWIERGSLSLFKLGRMLIVYIGAVAFSLLVFVLLKLFDML